MTRPSRGSGAPGLLLLVVLGTTDLEREPILDFRAYPSSSVGFDGFL